MLSLKLTHAVTAWAMNLFGWIDSGKDVHGDKLDAMWHMPEWGDLTLLPASGGVPFWGDFFAVPLTGSETIGAYLMAVWVFAVVGLVGVCGHILLAGGTEMYYCSPQGTRWITRRSTTRRSRRRAANPKRARDAWLPAEMNPPDRGHRHLGSQDLPPKARPG